MHINIDRVTASWQAVRVNGDGGTKRNLLLFVGVAFLLNNDDQKLLTLFLKDSDVGASVLQLARHTLHLLASLIDLVQTVLQLVGSTAQLAPFLIQQPTHILSIHSMLSRHVTSRLDTTRSTCRARRDVTDEPSGIWAYPLHSQLNLTCHL